LGGLLVGCSDKNKTTEEPAKPVSANTAATNLPNPVAPPVHAEQDTAATKGDGASDAQETKMNLYVECYNATSKRFTMSIDRYASWIDDMNVGPTGKEDNVYGLYSVSIGSCTDNIPKASKMSPAMPELDQAAQAYLAAIEPLSKTIDDANTYYDQENYKDDKFAKGKALHKPLLEQSKVFMAANDKFSDVLDKLEDQRSEARLNEMEKTSGRNLDYLHLAAMTQAKKLADMLSKDSFSADQATTKIDAFEKLLDELQANKETKPIMWSFYLSRLDDFRKAAKERMRRVRDKVAYTPFDQSMMDNDAAAMVQGSSEKLIKAYNDLVEASNRMN